MSAITPKKIVVIIDATAGMSARDVLSGIFRFVNAGHVWALRIVQLSVESAPLSYSRMIDDDIDGMIVSTSADESTNRAIATTQIPTVFVDVRNSLFEQRAARVSFVRNDNEGIGCAGAKYLDSLGRFNSYGFVPDIEGRAWSTLREKAFLRELAARKIQAEVFPGSSSRMSEDHANLIAWLRRLPKPTAIMGACDFRAAQVSEACAEAGLRIPEQIALLGVDNDELICLSATPPLSSIRPDHVGEGFRAATELNRLLQQGTRAKRREIFVRTQGVIERESTKPCPPSAALVRRTLAFIDANVRTNLHVETIASGLGVSRRLLECRFREARGESLHAYILNQRIALVKHLLRTTRRPVAKIAAECGFPNANSLSHIFAKTVGCSMRSYRTVIPQSPPIV